MGAKGECIRLAFSYLNIPFEDYVFANGEEFMKMKESGKLMFGQVPALEVTDKKTGKMTLLNQTGAILRFIPLCQKAIRSIPMVIHFLRLKLMLLLIKKRIRCPVIAVFCMGIDWVLNSLKMMRK